MISEKSFSVDWIIHKDKTKRGQTEIIEKVIYAFHLLESLSLLNIDFIFKGGSSLLLHFNSFHRFSVDIDILISEDNYAKLVEALNHHSNSRFIHVAEDIRKPSHIQKHHFKFYYQSVIRPNTEVLSYVLLDIVVDDNPYTKLIKRDIAFDLLDMVLPLQSINIPSVEEMLGDKLTAFAPNTIGIRYKDMKYTEIIKQLFDCSKLYSVCQDYDLVKRTYIEISKREIKYRELKGVEFSHCLRDSLDTCKLILSDGKSGDYENYKLLKKGITGFGNFTTTSFGIHDAVVCAMNVYRCLVILVCGSKENFLSHLYLFDEREAKALFLNKTQVKNLRIISGLLYREFLETIWVENEIIELGTI
ncbi:MAG: hypothetical protein FD133_300 [Erysipelotrichaceae bacterium]|nr:MAG: hypothetical protein FD179_1230 [Erysipelotrichaceae bacterium]TXT19482.1 MAG: hypothetical protein FD133_300 [Erysipelotrichaceae bacterium]